MIPSGQREERYRWDRFTLKVESAADRLRERLSKESDQEIVCELIQRELVVTRPFGNALKHFGYDTTLDGRLKLHDLVVRWTEETRNHANVSTDWIKGLCLEIKRAILAFPAEANWLQVNSVVYDRASYYPILNHMRVLPDGSMEFDVYFYAVHSN